LASVLRLDEIDISDPEFWLLPTDVRDAAFATLRDEEPVRWFDEFEFPESPIPKGPGYFAVTRYDDVWTASRNPELFCSGQGVNITDVPEMMREFLGSMIAMDDPKHFRLRSIVSKAFTPKEIARVEQYVTTVADGLVDDVLERFPERACDLVEHIAVPMPLRIICQMMGIDPADEPQVFAWTNSILGVGDPEYGDTIEVFMANALGMFAYAQALGEDRRATPRDDMASVMMAAEVDGERLTPQEFGSFFILLVVAGNETTRTAISHGVKLLTDHPDQRAQWFGDFDRHAKTATEEIVRYSSPVVHFRRTATADTELSGVPIKAGEKVVLWYNSANRDPRKFTDPERFDVTRDPNPQVGFGAGGPHFCLGANLARREITVMFDEIRRRLPDLHVTGEPDRLQSAFINGIKRMPCAW
jgi:methyl-branched lipid omega-hydroxylase